MLWVAVVEKLFYIYCIYTHIIGSYLLFLCFHKCNFNHYIETGLNFISKRKSFLLASLEYIYKQNCKTSNIITLHAIPVIGRGSNSGPLDQ